MPTIRLRKCNPLSPIIGRQYYRHITGDIYFEEDGAWFSATRGCGEPIEQVRTTRIELLNDQEVGLTYTQRKTNENQDNS